MTPPLLSGLILLPLAGALLVWLLPARLARRVAAGVLVAVLFAAAAAVVAFEPSLPGFQLVERRPWIAGLGIAYHLGVDGISVLFLPATALLFLGALVADWKTAEDAPRFHYSLLLALQACTLGVFCALDTILFFAFWELGLVPVYFLLGHRGIGAAAGRAAPRYFLFMLAGGVPLLFAFLTLAASQGVPTFDLVQLLAAPLPRPTQYMLLVLFLLGFGVKVPLVPLHTWLPQVALAAPGSLVALLAGLKVGAYGLIRFAVPLAPAAAADLHWLLAGLGTVAVLYGAVGTLSQTNLRVVLAYSSISHVGMAVLGLAALDARGVQGAVALVLGFAVASGGAFLLCEFLRQRTGSTDVGSLGGAAGTMPRLADGFLICGLAGVGMPGTSGFPGEMLIVLATLQSHTGAALGALFGLVVGAAGFLSIYRQAFWGPVTRPAVAQASDLLPREWAVLMVVVALAVGIGLYPGPVLDLIAPAAQAWAARLPG